MKNIIKKQVVYLIISIILVMGLFTSIVLFLNQINKKAVGVIEIKEKIASYQKNEKAFKEEVRQIQELQSRIENLEADVVSGENLPKLLSTFEKIAQKNNNEFQITSVQNPVVDEKAKLFIEFNTKGSYKDIQNLLEELQKQTFQTSFSKLSLLYENFEENSDQATESTPKISNEFWRAFATIEILSF